MAKITFKSLISLAFVISISLHACNKNDDDIIKDIPVNLTIYPSTPAYFDLSIVGGWIYVSGGVKGIIVYRKSISEFMAFDRNCTYNSNDPCAVVYVDSSNIIATDTCCNSRVISKK